MTIYARTFLHDFARFCLTTNGCMLKMLASSSNSALCCCTKIRGYMSTIKRRDVTIPFTQEQMQKAFTPIAAARKRRNTAKFNTPVGQRVTFA